MAKKNSTTKYRVKPSKELTSKIISAAALIAIGVLLCIFKSQVVQWIMLAFGIMLIVKGLLDFFAGATIVGGVEIVLGILAIIFGFTAAQLAVIVFGVIIALFGVSGLLNGGYKNLFTLIYCGIMVVGGILLACNASAAMDTMLLIMGIVLIVEGVLTVLDRLAKR